MRRPNCWSNSIKSSEKSVHQALFHQPTLRRQRERAAHALVHEAQLLYLIEQELVDRLDLLNQAPKDVLVVGAGGLITTRWLHQHWPGANVVVHDYAGALLDEHANSVPSEQHESVRWVCGERDQFALADESFDLVFSNMYLPWTDQADFLLKEFWRVLRAKGGVHFSTLGPDTFQELDRAWQRIDPESQAHVAQFPDMHDVGDALVLAGFKEPVMDRESAMLTYSNPASLWADMRRHGVHNGFTAQRKGMTGRLLWERFATELKQLSLGRDQLSVGSKEGAEARAKPEIAVSLEWVIGQAWKDPRLRQQQQADGSVAVPLGRLFENN